MLPVVRLITFKMPENVSLFRQQVQTGAEYRQSQKA